MKNNNEINKITVIAGYIVGILFLSWLFWEVYTYIDFRNNYTECNAVIVGFDGDANGNPLCIVEYYINGIKYRGNDYLNNEYGLKIEDTLRIRYYNKNYKRILFVDYD